MNSEDFVFHFVLARRGQPVAKGERIGTLVLTAARVAKLGELRVARAVDAERRRWQSIALHAGYADDHAVNVVKERGFRRSIFPAAAVPGLSSAPASSLVKV